MNWEVQKLLEVELEDVCLVVNVGNLQESNPVHNNLLSFRNWVRFHPFYLGSAAEGTFEAL